MAPEHPRPGPAHNLLHLLALRRLVAVHRTLLAGRFVLAKHALIKALVSVGVQRLIVRIIGLRLGTAPLVEGNHPLNRHFFPFDTLPHLPAFRLLLRCIYHTP